MKTTQVILFAVFLCLWSLPMHSQQSQFYGTITTKDAQVLRKLSPKDIEILHTEGEFSAVKLSHHAAEKLHHMILTHGPGFIYEPSKDAAIKTIKAMRLRGKQPKMAAYTISEQTLVNQAIGQVNNSNIAAHIQTLENYGTRYHTTQKARQSVLDLKQKWETMATGRSDVSVRIVNHNSTNMPSVVMTIQGKNNPNEYVIIGGHIDSVSPQRETNAPGADDNASGIATITEVARVLLNMNFKPNRTIEFMAYAAEEVGLRGSKEIAQDYKNRNVNVLSYVQFDMTNYKGSSSDVYITDDSYNSSSLNAFLVQLMEQYNKTGAHQFSYAYTRCNYGCSDHYSWAQQGFNAAFPFEASFNDSNPHIHTVNDTFDRSPTANATHAAKFAKLGLEYLIEVAKNEGSVTPPPTTTYCSSKGDNVSDEYIQKVVMGSISNSSGASNGYQDFTNLTTDIAQGATQNISITPKWTGSQYREAYSVWIDFNQDGDFSDSGEQVWTKAASTSSPATGSFTVPSTAKLGKTRMRVSMRYNSLPSACGNFNYGEVEDYSVTVKEGSAPINKCDGVAAYNAGTNYQVGDKVVYNNTLYQRSATGWTNLGSCTSAKSLATGTFDFLVNDAAVLQFSPNPVKNDEVNIKVFNELWQHKALLLINNQGKELLKIKLSKAQQKISLAKLPPGVYFFTLEHSGKQYTQKLLRE